MRSMSKATASTNPNKNPNQESNHSNHMYPNQFLKKMTESAILIKWLSTKSSRIIWITNKCSYKRLKNGNRRSENSAENCNRAKMMPMTTSTRRKYCQIRERTTSTRMQRIWNQHMKPLRLEKGEKKEGCNYFMHRSSNSLLGFFSLNPWWL